MFHFIFSDVTGEQKSQQFMVTQSVILQALGAGVLAGTISAFEAEQIIQFRSLCFECATHAEEGLWSLMTPEQKRLALLYFDTSYWQHKLAFLNWIPLALPAVSLAPQLLDRLANDLSVTVEWFKYTLPFTDQREAMSAAWECYHGMQTERFDSKVVRFISTLAGIALGVGLVACGDLTGSSFIASCSSLLSSCALGTSAFGLLVGGTYGGSSAQELSKQVLRIWHKLCSGLPFHVLVRLSAEQEKEICQRLSLHYFESPWLSWLNKLRIRLATGDSYLPGKAWVRQIPTENENQIVIDGHAYRVDRKVNTYSDQCAWIGAAAIAGIGFFTLGPLGAIVGAILGHYFGNKLGSVFSYHTKMRDLDLNPETASGGLNQILYERLQHIEYKLLKQNFFTHIYKSYYRNVYENIQGHQAKRVIVSLALGTLALLFDMLKTLIKWPKLILKNLFEYFSPGQTWNKLAFIFSKLGQEYQNAHTPKEVVKFIGKLIGNTLLSLIIVALKLPKILLGALLYVFNPIAQTDYMKQRNELQTEKAWLKQELNSHSLASVQSEADEQNKAVVNKHFMERYRDHLQLKRDTSVRQIFKAKPVMSFFSADISSERKQKIAEKWEKTLDRAGCSYA